MYIGTQKKAMVIKNSGDSIFEEAYFILKDDISNIKESEMVREANKILKNNIIGGYFFENKENEEKKTKKGSITSFLAGALISFVICTFLFVLAK